MNASFQVRQLAQYPRVGVVEDGFVALLQAGEIGSPYVSIEASDLVASALAGANGGSLQLNAATGSIVFGPPNIVLNAVSGNFTFSAPIVCPSIDTNFITASSVTINGFPAVTAPQLASVAANSVTSFNQRQGDVLLETTDILRAGGAPQANPVFSGWVVAPSHWDPRLDDDTVATANWVQRAMCQFLESWLELQPVVFTFNGRAGNITLLTSDVNAAYAVPGPPFPTSSNPALGDASNRIATTLFVDDSLADLEGSLKQEIQDAIPGALTGYAPINSPAFTGTPTAPTPAPGNSSGDIATTAFVHNAIVASTTGVASFNTRTGAVVLTSADITGAGGALLVSPAFTGVPTAPTPPPGNNSTDIATTAFVTAAVSSVTAGVSSFNTRTGAVTLQSADVTGVGGALIASPNFTGMPTAPTAAVATNTTQLATTAFVQAAIAAIGTGVTSFNGRTGAITLIGNDVSAAGGALIAGPTFTGVPQAPTAAPGTNTNQLATTAYVMAALTTSGVASFNGRTGVVTLTTGDITGAGGAPISSPSLTGTPTSPTPTQTSNDNTLATTAFVHSAVTAAGGVSSFNTRTGAVTLSLADVTGAGGAPLASPTFTGVPAGPTASPGTSTTQLATTAFVAAATAASVSSFNGRTGAVTFQANDVSAVGGALLASPAFTGSPTAPTQTAGTSNTTLATTAFVANALSTAGGVISFNGRAGAVTLTTADVTGAGGAPLASPTFTGTPQAPTPATSDNSTSLATTAFVKAQVAVVRSYLAGLTISMAPSSSSFNVAAGVACNSSGIGMITLPGPWSKTTAAWASGSGSGSLDTGVIANTTWYHVYVIGSSSSSSVDILISTSAVSPAMPSGFNWFRRIGSIRTNASGQWTVFHQLGNEFLWDVPNTDVNSGTFGTAAVLATLLVPPGVQVNALFRGLISNASAGIVVLINSPDEAVAAANVPSGNVTVQNVNAGASGGTNFTMNVRTSTSGQIRIVSSAASTTVIIATYGWIDTRGRDI